MPGISIVPSISISGLTGVYNVLHLETDEQVFGSTMVVDIDRSTWAGADVAGKPVTITLTPGGGIPAGWVWHQEEVSVAGRKLLRLTCVDAWQLLALSNPNLGAQAWNHPEMLDAGVVKPRFANYWNKNIAAIIGAVLNDTIGATLSGGASMPDICPTIIIQNALSGIGKALQFTPGFLRADGSAFTYIVNPALSYSYATGDGVQVVIYATGAVVPNKVMVESVNASAVSSWYQEADPLTASGEAVDNDSFLRLGKWVVSNVLDLSGLLTNKAQCDALASSILDKYRAEVAVGEVTTIHTHSQKVLDKIQATDARGTTVTGMITRIRRTYDRGIYQAVFTLGGAVGSSLPPTAAPAAPIQPMEMPPTSMVNGATDIIKDTLYSELFKKGIQPYISNLLFEPLPASPYTQVGCGAGTIKFADGTTQSINAWDSSSTYPDGIPSGVVHYIYFEVGSPVLLITDNYLLVWGDAKGLLCEVYVSTQETDAEIGIQPYAAKGLNLVVDFLGVKKLSAIAVDLGVVTAGTVDIGDSACILNKEGIKLNDMAKAKGVGFASYFYKGFEYYTGFESLDGFYKHLTNSGSIEHGVDNNCVNVKTGGTQYSIASLRKSFAYPSTRLHWVKGKRCRTEINIVPDTQFCIWLGIGTFEDTTITNTNKHVGVCFYGGATSYAAYTSVGNGTAQTYTLRHSGLTGTKIIELEIIFTPGQAKFIFGGALTGEFIETANLPEGGDYYASFVWVSIYNYEAVNKQVSLSEWFFLQEP